jgi:hypothetical protein
MKALTSLVLFSTFVSVSAFANHNGGGGSPTDTLLQEANELNQIVSYSTLRWPVKSAVQSFDSAAQQLATCDDDDNGQGANATLHEPIEEPMHHNGDSCSFQLQNVLNTWSQVDRYLYDTNFDYPQVYNQYLSTRQAVQAVQFGGGNTNPNPNPYPNPIGQYSATGQLNAYAFSFVGQSQQDISSQCLNWGARNGLTWVNQVTVNGRVVSVGHLVHISQACTMVSQNAVYH